MPISNHNATSALEGSTIWTPFKNTQHRLGSRFFKDELNKLMDTYKNPAEKLGVLKNILSSVPPEGVGVGFLRGAIFDVMELAQTVLDEAHGIVVDRRGRGKPAGVIFDQSAAQFDFKDGGHLKAVLLSRGGVHDPRLIDDISAKAADTIEEQLQIL